MLVAPLAASAVVPVACPGWELGTAAPQSLTKANALLLHRRQGHLCPTSHLFLRSHLLTWLIAEEQNDGLRLALVSINVEVARFFLQGTRFCKPLAANVHELVSFLFHYLSSQLCSPLVWPPFTKFYNRFQCQAARYKYSRQLA